jgi:Fe2+ or Zn2+ uptake regulation protein
MSLLQMYRTAAKILKNFLDSKELNEHLLFHIQRAGKRLHKNARTILDMMAKHAVKYSGVCWLHPQTIADQINVHIKTVKRALALFKELGIIQVVQTEAGGISMTFYVFQKVDLSSICQELVSHLSTTQTTSSPDIPKDEDTSVSAESIESLEAIKKDINYRNTFEYITSEEWKKEMMDNPFTFYNWLEETE